MTRREIDRRYALLSGLRWLPIGLMLPLATLVPLARGLSLTEIGIVFTVHGVVALLCEVPSGALADSIGRRRALLAGGLLMTVGILAFAAATSLLAFAAAFVGLGAGRALISGSLEAWYVDTLRALDPTAPLRGGLAAGLAFNGVALGVGSLVAGALPLVTPGLPAAGDALLIRYSPPYLLAACAGLVFVVAVARLVTDPPRAPADAAAVEVRLLGELRRTFAVAAGEVRRSRTVRLVVAVGAAVGLALTAWEVLWQPRLAGLVGGAADDTLLFGALNAASMLVGTAATLWGVRLARRLGPAPVYVGGILLGGLALGGLAAATAVGPFALAYVLVIGALALGEPLHHEFLHDAVGARARATVVSIEALAVQVGAVGANLVLAPLADATSIPVAWAVAAGVLVLGAAIASRVPGAAAAST